MQITKVELKNFKRFTELTIDGIPATARLVLLIGSNGSGKSSVFDAFESFNRAAKHENIQVVLTGLTAQFSEQGYLQKKITQPFQATITTADQVVLALRGDVGNDYSHTAKPDNFYGRTSFRQTPRLTRTQLGQGDTVDLAKDSDRPHYFIDRDNRFENDLDRIYERILQDVFRADTSSRQIRQTYLDPINRALSRIFGLQAVNQLILTEIIPPLEGKIAQLVFRKGESDIHYNNLSAGEKEVVNILFNLLVRRDLFKDTVYFFDEIDLHLNTTRQFNLLKEITENWIPENCQLWTASHALGFIDYARQYEHGVILDFDDLDFDYPQALYPQPKESLEIYEVAIPKVTLARIMQGKRLVICENKNDQFYNLLSFADTLFIGVKDARDVFLTIKRDSHYTGLRDRDFLSDEEIVRLRKQYPNYRILDYYDFENYLYHPNNLAELNVVGFDVAAYKEEIVRQKKEKIFYILATLDASRQTYEEFKTDAIKDKDRTSIIEDLKSDEFEQFYKYFDMKSKFTNTYLMPFNISKTELVQTNWFRQQIEKILQ